MSVSNPWVIVSCFHCITVYAYRVSRIQSCVRFQPMSDCIMFPLYNHLTKIDTEKSPEMKTTIGSIYCSEQIHVVFGGRGRGRGAIWNIWKFFDSNMTKQISTAASGKSPREILRPFLRSMFKIITIWEKKFLRSHKSVVDPIWGHFREVWSKCHNLTKPSLYIFWKES